MQIFFPLQLKILRPFTKKCFLLTIAFLCDNVEFTPPKKKKKIPGEGSSSSGPRYSTLLTVRLGFKLPPNPPSKTVPSEQQPWVGELGSWHMRPLDSATSGQEEKKNSKKNIWIGADYCNHLEDKSSWFSSQSIKSKLEALFMFFLY